MYVENVKVFDENGSFIEKNIWVSDGRFSYEGSSDVVIDGKGCYLIPGLIDIHLHGCAGADVCDGTIKALDKICEYELSKGITSICPTTMTIADNELEKVIVNIAEYSNKRTSDRNDLHDANCKGMDAQIKIGRENKLRSKIVGINLEGPFISKEKAGAHKAEYVKDCDFAYFERLYELSCGLIRIVDVAPEKDGAIDFINKVSNKATVSLAHTLADYEKSIEAFNAGASHVTHLYNAMPAFNHREPGLVGAALDTKNAYVELICDGVHVHPSVIRASFEMFGADRIIMISDSMRAAGLVDGRYSLGGQEVVVNGGRACLNDGTIAGSVCDLMDGLRFLVQKAQIPFVDALTCATINPAKRLGIFNEVGSITNGKIADFVLLDDNLEILAVYKEGQKVCQ